MLLIGTDPLSHQSIGIKRVNTLFNFVTAKLNAYIIDVHSLLSMNIFEMFFTFFSMYPQMRNLLVKMFIV